MSCGQRLRIGVAKAPYKQVNIFMFDEVVGAVDGVTESAAVEFQNRSSRGWTVVFSLLIVMCNRVFEP